MGAADSSMDDPVARAGMSQPDQDLRTCRADSADVLKEESRQRSGSVGQRLRRSLRGNKRRSGQKDDLCDGEMELMMAKDEDASEDEEENEQAAERIRHDVFVLHQGGKRETEMATVIAKQLWLTKKRIRTILFSVENIRYIPSKAEVMAKNKLSPRGRSSSLREGSSSAPGTPTGTRKGSRDSLKKKQILEVEEIPPMTTILDMVEKAKVFVVVLSEPLLDNSIMNRLVATAFVNGVAIVPLSCHGQSQVQSQVKFGTRLILELSHWFFASQEEKSTSFRSLRTHILHACKQAQFLDTFGGGLGRSNSSPQLVRLSRAIIRDRDPTLPKSFSSSNGFHPTPESTASLSYPRQPTPASSSPASFPEPVQVDKVQDDSNNSFEFWEKHINTDQEKKVSASSPEIQSAITTCYWNTFQRVCTNADEESRFLELIMDQLFKSKSEITRQECEAFIESQLSVGAQQDMRDRWWAALLRATALQLCIEYV